MKYFILIKRCRKLEPLSAFLGAPVIGSAISGIANFISGNKQANTQKAIADAQIKLHREQMEQQQRQFDTQLAYNDKAWMREQEAALDMFQRQRAAAKEDFQMENSYNSPVAQRARYEAAGLNPALMMQGGNAAVGQMEATSGSVPSSPTAPSPAGMPAIPNIQAPDMSFIGASIDRALSTYSQLQQARVYEEQANQLGIANLYRHYQEIADLQNKVADYDNKLANTKLTAEQRDLIEAQKKQAIQQYNFAVDVADDLKRGIKWDNNVKIMTWKKLQSDKKEVDTRERILRIEEEFKPRVLEAGIRLSNAQIRDISQRIAESQQRIEDMVARLVEEKRNNKEIRKKIRIEAQKIYRDYLNSSPNSEFSKKEFDLILSQIYNNLRISGPFGVKVSHPNTWFGDSDSWLH